MQHPAVMSSFPPHRPVWLQYCQSWACSVAFKITMSFFDNAHSVKQRQKSWKKSLTFSLRFIQMSSMKVKYAHIHTLVNMSIIFLILCTLFILFSLFVFCFTLTRYLTSPNSQLLPRLRTFMTWAKSFNLSPYVRAPIPSHFSSTGKHMTRTHVLCGFC